MATPSPPLPSEKSKKRQPLLATPCMTVESALSKYCNKTYVDYSIYWKKFLSGMPPSISDDYVSFVKNSLGRLLVRYYGAQSLSVLEVGPGSDPVFLMLSTMSRSISKATLLKLESKNNE